MNQNHQQKIHNTKEIDWYSSPIGWYTDKTNQDQFLSGPN